MNFTNNDKLITKVIHKLKGKPCKQLYNYNKFGSPINQKLSEGLLKIRSRNYSKNNNTKLKFCRMRFSFKDIQIHHLDYKNPNKTKILCRNCHMKIHKKQNAKHNF